MRTIFIWTAALCLASCERQDASEKQAAPTKPTNQQAKLTGDVTRFGDLVKIRGETNLPSDTELWFALERQGSRRYAAEGKLTVTDGRFESSPVSNRGNSFQKGKYILSIQTPLYDIQPAHIKERLGNQYSNFTGKLISDAKYGGKIIKFEKVTDINWDGNSPWVPPKR